MSFDQNSEILGLISMKFQNLHTNLYFLGHIFKEQGKLVIMCLFEKFLNTISMKNIEKMARRGLFPYITSYKLGCSSQLFQHYLARKNAH